MEVWIEIKNILTNISEHDVTSLVEVWIEIGTDKRFSRTDMSLPLWKCGLKLLCYASLHTFLQSLPLWKCGLKSLLVHILMLNYTVTSLVEVWIEIPLRNTGKVLQYSHFPCGSVD